jgi:hypothetical protein
VVEQLAFNQLVLSSILNAPIFINLLYNKAMCVA